VTTNWKLHALILLLFGSAAMCRAELTVACIDMDKVFLDYYKTKAAQREIDAEKKQAEGFMIRRKGEIDALQAKLRDAMGAAKNPVLSEEAKTTKAAEAAEIRYDLENKVRDLKGFHKETTRKLGTRFRGYREDILEEISAVIQEFAKEHGYKLVLDTSGQTSNLIAPIVYFDASFDITPVIIEMLNRGQVVEEKEAAATAPAE